MLASARDRNKAFGFNPNRDQWLADQSETYCFLCRSNFYTQDAHVAHSSEAAATHCTCIAGLVSACDSTGSILSLVWKFFTVKTNTHNM